MSMKESDVLFRSIIDTYLGTDADIIHNKALEPAVVKIQSNKDNTLTDQEKASVEPLLLQPQVRLQDIEAAAMMMMCNCPLQIVHSSDNACKRV